LIMRTEGFETGYMSRDMLFFLGEIVELPG